MEEFFYKFRNGFCIKIILGEDGYNVNMWGINKPLMGTFTDFHRLMHGIGDMVFINVSGSEEMDDFVKKLDMNISNVYTVDEIREMLEM